MRRFSTSTGTDQAREAGRQSDGKFGTQPHSSPDRNLVDEKAELDARGFGKDPSQMIPEQAFEAISHPAIVDRYTLGDCYLLAHAVAEKKGWGVVVVGSYDDSDPDFVMVEEIIHAYARRPDGRLVDVRGVHEFEAAEELAYGAWGAPLHTYASAEEADKHWDHASQGPPEDYEDAQYTGEYVGRFGATFEPF